MAAEPINIWSPATVVGGGGRGVFNRLSHAAGSREETLLLLIGLAGILSSKAPSLARNASLSEL